MEVLAGKYIIPIMIDLRLVEIDIYTYTQVNVAWPCPFPLYNPKPNIISIDKYKFHEKK
jgi:hypothetical protein